MSQVITLLTIVFVYKLVNWFLDPYFKYKNRKQNKDYEVFCNGKINSK